MLSPKELRNHTFEQYGRNSYKASEVDEYFKEVIASYEQMFRENGEIVKKLQAVADKLSEYKKDEENIRNALLEAQRMRSSILDDANKKANDRLTVAEEKIKVAKENVDKKTSEIIEQANVVADDIVNSAKKDADAIIANAEKESENLKAKAKVLYEQEVGSVNDEAKKAKAYLESIKTETARVRKELMDTYESQLDMLKLLPDFSASLSASAAEKDEDELVDAMDTISEELKDSFEADDTANEIYKSLANLDEINEYLTGGAEDEADSDSETAEPDEEAEEDESETESEDEPEADSEDEPESQYDDETPEETEE